MKTWKQKYLELERLYEIANGRVNQLTQANFVLHMEVNSRAKKEIGSVDVTEYLRVCKNLQAANERLKDQIASRIEFDKLRENRDQYKIQLEAAKRLLERFGHLSEPIPGILQFNYPRIPPKKSSAWNIDKMREYAAKHRPPSQKPVPFYKKLLSFFY